MTKDDICAKIKDFLLANDKDATDNDVESYVYRAAYNQLMIDMYGTDPISQILRQSKPQSQQENVPSDEVQKPSVGFGKKVLITSK